MKSPALLISVAGFAALAISAAAPIIYGPLVFASFVAIIVLAWTVILRNRQHTIDISVATVLRGPFVATAVLPSHPTVVGLWLAVAVAVGSSIGFALRTYV